MGRQEKPHLYLSELTITRSDASAYFLFNRELATDYGSALGIARSVCASAMALEIPVPIDFPIEELFATATQTDCPKLLVKVTYDAENSTVEIFSRE